MRWNRKKPDGGYKITRKTKRALIGTCAAVVAVVLAAVGALTLLNPGLIRSLRSPEGSAARTSQVSAAESPVPTAPASQQTSSPTATPAATAAAETVTAKYAVNNTLLVNPLIGWVTDASNLDVVQLHTLVFATFSWADVESAKGVYDFRTVEKKNNFDYWKSRGVKIIIRLYLDYPRKTAHRDIPDWLYEEMGRGGTAYKNDYGQGFSPDYNNPLLVAYHEKLIQAMAERYDNDPSIAFVELGSLGHWGEWHTGYNNGKKIPFASQSVCSQITIHYVNSFQNKLLMMRRPTDIAAQKNLGLFNDSFGDIFQTESYFINWFTNGYRDTQNNNWNPPMKEFWRFAPSGGEVANYPGTQYFTDANIDRTMSQLKASHLSWLGPSGPYVAPAAQIKKNLDKALQAMGYKFTVTQSTVDKEAKAGTVLHLSVQLKNIGIAPFYYPWPVNVYLFDATGAQKFSVTAPVDIRTIQPDGQVDIGCSIRLPNEYKGDYALKIGIADPAAGQPAVHFANAGNGVLFQLCTVSVK